MHLDWQTLSQYFILFESRKYNLFLLIISLWTHIKQLSPYDSLPNLPSVGIKLSNRFYSLNSTTENLKIIQVRIEHSNLMLIYGMKKKLHIDLILQKIK